MFSIIRLVEQVTCDGANSPTESILVAGKNADRIETLQRLAMQSCHATQRYERGEACLLELRWYHVNLHTRPY